MNLEMKQRALQNAPCGAGLSPAWVPTASGAAGASLSPHAHPLPAGDRASSCLLESAGAVLSPLKMSPPWVWVPESPRGTECSLSPAPELVSSRSRVLIISFHFASPAPLPTRSRIPRAPARPEKGKKMQGKLPEAVLAYVALQTCQAPNLLIEGNKASLPVENVPMALAGG